MPHSTTPTARLSEMRDEDTNKENSTLSALVRGFVQTQQVFLVYNGYVRRSISEGRHRPDYRT